MAYSIMMAVSSSERPKCQVREAPASALFHSNVRSQFGGNRSTGFLDPFEHVDHLFAFGFVKLLCSQRSPPSP